jgi:oligopeptide/dipeptide ABC transporter ATP-binding protein
MGEVRGGRIGVVFQDPASALDPVQTVGSALREAMRFHGKLSARELRARSVQLLDEVSLPDPERALAEYPHRLSGGMRQRVMIAIALAAGPELLLADEPTASLDRPLEGSILDLLDRLREERGLSVLLITHDLLAAGRRCDRIAIMYAGKIVEQGPAKSVLESPSHPYTRALRACLDGRSSGRPGALPVISGQAPRPRPRAGRACSFAPRCPDVFDPCSREDPPAFSAGEARVRCFLRAS